MPPGLHALPEGSGAWHADSNIVRDNVVVSRLELDDVIDGSRLEGDQLVIETMDGRSIVVVIEPDELRPRT